MELTEALERLCSKCKNKRPKTKNRCNVYYLAIVKKDPAVISMLGSFMDESGMCKGFELKE